MSAGHERLHAWVRGGVQGVGFRDFTLTTAQRLNLSGWVRNVPDGSVELAAEGPRPALEQLLAAVRQGPRSARVTEVQADWSPAAGDLGPFDVRW